MSALKLGIDISGFDLQRVGVVLSVRDNDARPVSTSSPLNMSLIEFNALIKALDAERSAIEVSTRQSRDGTSMPPDLMPGLRNANVFAENEPEMVDAEVVDVEKAEAAEADTGEADAKTAEADTAEAVAAVAKAAAAQPKKTKARKPAAKKAKAKKAEDVKAAEAEADTADVDVPDAKAAEVETVEAAATEAEAVEMEAAEVEAKAAEVEAVEAETAEVETVEAETVEADTAEAETMEAEALEADIAEVEIQEVMVAETDESAEATTDEELAVETEDDSDSIEVDEATDESRLLEWIAEDGDVADSSADIDDSDCVVEEEALDDHSDSDWEVEDDEDEQEPIAAAPAAAQKITFKSDPEMIANYKVVSKDRKSKAPADSDNVGFFGGLRRSLGFMSGQDSVPGETVSKSSGSERSVAVRDIVRKHIEGRSWE